jgi:dimethylhistidine N-methyltransferase
MRAHTIGETPALIEGQGPAHPPETDTFAQDMHAALRNSPRQISPKYFYDAQGSALFDAICDTPEYYPTRTEHKILATYGREMAAHIGADVELIEFGAGSCVKVQALLDHMQGKVSFRPIDISGDHLALATARLALKYPHIEVRPVVGDYTTRLSLPESNRRRRVGFFPGSTLGNFTPDEALRFLENAARLLRGGGLLIGVDLIKRPEQLHAAYNDQQGATAAFNKNLLLRANRELGTNFNLDQFDHSAFYNAPQQRVEMHLVSRKRQTIELHQHRYIFEQGQTLHTENSYKFTIDGLRQLAARAGWRADTVWTDPDHLFSLHWLIAP